MAAELGPGHLLDDFLERADAARHGDEGVGHFEHLAFALVHVLGDDQLVLADQRVLVADQELRDDAGDLAAVVEDGAGDRAHHAFAAAAIDQADAGFGHGGAERGRGLDEGRVGARAGAAIDADFRDF